MNFLQFDYAGQKYRYQVLVFAPTEEKGFEDCMSEPTAPKFAMAYDGIRRIEYWNSMLDPLLRGQIDYVDMYGDMSVYVGMPYVYCSVSLLKVETREGRETAGEEDCKFSHIFLVESIDILDRVQNRVRYKLNLVSRNWWNFQSTVSYSNYDLPEPEPVSSVIKNLFQQHKLKLTTPESLATRCPVYYISTPQDTLLTAYKHLLSKAYSNFAELNGDTIRPIVYNDIDGQYYWVDVKDPSTWQEQRGSKDSYVENIGISLWTNMNQFMMQGKNFLASANGVDRTDVYGFLRRANVYKYDFDLAQFAQQSSTQAQRAAYLNSQMKAGSHQNKFLPFDNTQEINQKPADLNELNYYRVLCDWQNGMNDFTRGLDIMSRSDTVVVNAAGAVTRRPGICLYLGFDTDEQQAISDKEQISQYKSLKSKMVGLEGMWFVTFVRHVLDFTKRTPTFRDDVTLGRNFRMG